MAVTQQEEAALREWLSWLQNINLQKNISFIDSTSAIDLMFQRGELDWIPCRDVSILSHQQHFGSHLGVSTLPGRNGRPASAISGMIVASFGRDSSAQQREAARQFSLFLLGRFIQREMMFYSHSLLPVNARVIVPENSSETLGALARSLRAGVLLSLQLPGPTAQESNVMDDALQSIVLGGEDDSASMRRLNSFFFTAGP